MTSLKIYNTYNNKKEDYVPIHSNKIGMYVCGPTVYDFPHIGNARPLVVFDILYRVLIKFFNKYSVNYVRNITDIDDKIIERTNELKISIKDLTEQVTEVFLSDCKYLNCLSPNYQPRATNHIKEMILMIEQLIAKKFAYVKDGNVYFEVSKFNDYGKLSNKKPKDLISGARVEVSELKKNPLDFVLWKPSKVNEPSWDSPWGKGRPGWHLECSAMSEKYLGNTFDFHCGGLDLIFPHHENEIAQSVCSNSTNFFAKYWLHNGYVTVNGKKMSKSDGNFISIQDLKQNYNGQIVRLAILGSHYRQPLDWNLKILDTNKKILEGWYEYYTGEHAELDDEFLNILLDDLNTPQFITHLHNLFSKVKTGDENARIKFNSALQFLGLFNESKEKFYASKKVSHLDKAEVERLIQLRNAARKSKDFGVADKIREDLEKNGIIIEDLNDTTTWKYK